MKVLAFAAGYLTRLVARDHYRTNRGDNSPKLIGNRLPLLSRSHQTSVDKKTWTFYLEVPLIDCDPNEFHNRQLANLPGDIGKLLVADGQLCEGELQSLEVTGSILDNIHLRPQFPLGQKVIDRVFGSRHKFLKLFPLQLHRLAVVLPFHFFVGQLSQQSLF